MPQAISEQSETVFTKIAALKGEFDAVADRLANQNCVKRWWDASKPREVNFRHDAASLQTVAEELKSGGPFDPSAARYRLRTMKMFFDWSADAYEKTGLDKKRAAEDRKYGAKVGEILSML